MRLRTLLATAALTAAATGIATPAGMALAAPAHHLAAAPDFTTDGSQNGDTGQGANWGDGNWNSSAAFGPMYMD